MNWYAHERPTRVPTTTLALEGESIISWTPGLVKGNRHAIPVPTRAIGSWPEDQLARYLRDRRVDLSVTRLNGWYPSYDAGDSELRVVIPCTRTSMGRFWQARRIQGGLSGAVGPRWQSPHGCDREDALCLVYTPVAGATARSLVVVEGPFDAAVAAGYGHDAVALMGNTPPARVKAHLLRFFFSGYSEMVCIADADALDKMQELMVYCGSGGKTSLISTSPAKDLAEADDELRTQLLGGE